MTFPLYPPLSPGKAAITHTHIYTHTLFYICPANTGVSVRRRPDSVLIAFELVQQALKLTAKGIHYGVKWSLSHNVM